MNKSLRLVGLSGLVALSVFAIAQEALTLKRTVKQGEVTRYKLSASMSYQGQDITFSATITDSIKKIADNGDYTVESVSSDSKISVGGNEQPAGMEQTSSTTFKANGTVVEATGEEDTAYRVAVLQAFVMPEKPLKVGDTWDVDVKPDAKHKSPGVKATYKVEAFEKKLGFDTVRLKATGKELGGETPASYEGQVWLSTKDGSLVQLDAQMKNYPAAGMVFDTHTVVTRVEVKS